MLCRGGWSQPELLSCWELRLWGDSCCLLLHLCYPPLFPHVCAVQCPFISLMLGQHCWQHTCTHCTSTTTCTVLCELICCIMSSAHASRKPASGSVHHLGPDWNISISAIRMITMKLWTAVDSPLRMNANDFCDLLTALPSGRHASFNEHNKYGKKLPSGTHPPLRIHF